MTLPEREPPTKQWCPRTGGRTQPLTLAAMSLGFVVVQLDVTIVNVALRRIGESVGGGVAGLQWVVNAYSVVFASLILTAGAAGDRFGAKRVFIAGFRIFVLASLGAGIAPNLSLLVLARALQGLGAAILVPCSLALLNHAYATDEARTNAIGVWAAGVSVALAAGPVVGGLLIAAIGWRSIFFMNVPIGVLGIWLTWQYAQDTTQLRNRELDLPGQAIAIFAPGRPGRGNHRRGKSELDGSLGPGWMLPIRRLRGSICHS